MMAHRWRFASLRNKITTPAIASASKALLIHSGDSTHHHDLARRRSTSSPRAA